MESDERKAIVKASSHFTLYILYIKLLFLLLAASSSAASQDDTTISILRSVNEIQKNKINYSYHIVRKDNYNDYPRITTMEAICEVNRVSSDTLFRCKFKVTYKNMGSKIDYLYDLKNTYLAVYNDKTILQTDVSKYPKESRMIIGVLFLPDELIDTDIIDLYKKNHVQISSAGKNENYDVIKCIYPVSQDGSQLTKNVYINSSTKMIEKINEIVLWNGVKYDTEMSISDFKNYPVTETNIGFSQMAYSGFKSNIYENKTENKNLNNLIKAGFRAPDFFMTDAHNNKISLSSFNGKFVLLDFWEPWCAWCIKEFPDLQKFYDSLRENKFLLISLTSAADDRSASIITQGKYSFCVGKINKKVLMEYHVSARPTYYLLDPSGKVLLSGNAEILNGIKKMLRSKFCAQSQQ
jgi:thiol-disulfide isomerase/thioredoxin